MKADISKITEGDHVSVRMKSYGVGTWEEGVVVEIYEGGAKVKFPSGFIHEYPWDSIELDEG